MLMLLDIVIVGISHWLVIIQMLLLIQVIILNVICKSHCQTICML
jgi:hypothetical protein